MILTVVRVSWLTLRRSPVELALTFLLPIVFFSIFAVIMGGMVTGTMDPIRIAIVDEDGTAASKRFGENLAAEESLRVVRRKNAEGADVDRFDRATGEKLVRDGKAAIAVVLPKGFGASFGAFSANDGEGAELLVDSSNPVAAQMVSGLMQKAAFGSVDLIADRGMEMFERFAGVFTPDQKKNVDRWKGELAKLRAAEPAKDAGKDVAAKKPGLDGFGLVSVKVTDLLRENKPDKSIVSFECAAIAVMFLLFSAVGAGGSLLEEEESGTLERLLGSRLSMTGLLLGKWLFAVLLGTLQIIVMFVWGSLVFKLTLHDRLPAFLVITVFTAAAAASFGLMLATLCRSRAQLQGISTIIVLSMSAVGGSMIPRPFMGEAMQTLGLVTFNAWALDGLTKIFWRDAAWWQLSGELAVLTVWAVVGLAIARLLARRFETV
jgi:ABC-2 type transport system permease protein